MRACFSQRGFLPCEDPAQKLILGAPWERFEQLCRDLPSLLEDKDFRRMAKSIQVPRWPYERLEPQLMPQLRLYYLRLAFLVAGYLHQRGQPPAQQLPVNLARPWMAVCGLMQRPPVLSYEAYVLSNWRRRDPHGPIALGNLETLQNFAHLFDEHWYILLQVESEALGAQILEVVENLLVAPNFKDSKRINHSLNLILDGLRQQNALYRRLPERASLSRLHEQVCPYLGGIDDVVFEGVREAPLRIPNTLAEQGALVPLLEALFKSASQSPNLTRHLARLRGFMPESQRRLIERVMLMPSLKPVAAPDLYNATLEALAALRLTQSDWLQSGEEAEPSASHLWMRQEVQALQAARVQ